MDEQAIILYLLQMTVEWKKYNGLLFSYKHPRAQAA